MVHILTHEGQTVPKLDKRYIEQQSGKDEGGSIQVLELRLLEDGRHHQVARDYQHYPRDYDRNLETNIIICFNYNY